MKVIITGAGIGGLTTAIALQQKGISYSIYDAAPENKAVGAGIMLSANAMSVFDRLGVAEALTNASVLSDYFHIRDYKENILQTIDNHVLKRNYGQFNRAIHRATLQNELIKAVQSPVQWGKKCVRIDENPLTVHFEDGTSDTGDIVIAADGIRSHIRETYVEKATYRYSGQTCWRATIPMDLPEHELQEASERWGNGDGLRGMYNQVGPQQVYFWMTKRMPAGTKFSQEDALVFIRKEMRMFSGYMQDVLQHMTADTLIHSDLYDIAPLKRWHKGKIVLLGDAAHATTPNVGQGASQAIEDAYVLADCLAKYKDAEQAFQAYRNIRIRRVNKIVNISWQIGQMTNMKGKIAVGFRNWLMRSMPKSITDRQMKLMYDIPYIYEL